MRDSSGEQDYNYNLGISNGEEFKVKMDFSLEELRQFIDDNKWMRLNVYGEANKIWVQTNNIATIEVL